MSIVHTLTTICPDCGNKDCIISIFEERLDASEPGGPGIDWSLDSDDRCDECGYEFTDLDAVRIGEAYEAQGREDEETRDCD